MLFNADQANADQCLSKKGCHGPEWKSHGISGILQISGKVMECRPKLTKVMEKSWNFEIRTKSHGNVMKFDQ